MPRVYSYFTVALSAAMAVNGLAAPEITARAVLAQRAQNCPYLNLADNGFNGCCVGGNADEQKPFLSVCEGWPICGNNPTTTTWKATPMSCAAFVAYSDANYDADLSSAEKAFSAGNTALCYTVGGADNCASGSAAKATTTSEAPSETGSGDASATGGDGADGGDGGDAAATGGDASATGGQGGEGGEDGDASGTGGDASATGGTSVGDAGSDGSAVNSGSAAGNTGTSQSGANGSSSSSNSGSNGSSSSTSNTSGGSSSSSGASSSTTTTTTTSDTSGATTMGLGWGAWALGLAGVGPVMMAVML